MSPGLQAVLRQLAGWITLLAVLFTLLLPADCVSDALAAAPDDRMVSTGVSDEGNPSDQHQDDTSSGGCDCLCANPSCPAHGVIRPESDALPATTSLGACTQMPVPDDARAPGVIDGIFHPPQPR